MPTFFKEKLGIEALKLIIYVLNCTLGLQIWGPEGIGPQHPYPIPRSTSENSWTTVLTWASMRIFIVFLKDKIKLQY